MSNPYLDTVELLSQQELYQLKNSRGIRMEIAKKDLYWFFHIYFSHYIEFETADFHREIFNYVSNDKIEHLVILAFRGSGKSTIISMAYPLWAMIGVMQKKYVVIVSQTQQQAQQHLRNLRAEIESNELFRNDFGNLEEESNEWGISALNMPQLGAKIIAVSREQSIRGLRSGANRPDLVISDDVEDTNSVKTREGRNKTYDWFTSEIMPIGSLKTKFVTVGNLLHEDSLLMRLKDSFTAGSQCGTYVEYPIDKDGKSMWPGMYPDMEAIERQQKRIGNRLAWEREYRLNIMPSDEQIILPSMIKRYSTIPSLLYGEHHEYVIGVDLAISLKDTADFTSMVKIDLRGVGQDIKMYVLPIPVNKRLSFNSTIDYIKILNTNFYCPKFYIESTAYQDSAVQSLKAYGINAIGVKPRADKRSRLNMIADKIERGIIIFPETGCEELIAQLVGFSVEKHDDLVDALTIAVLEIMDIDYSAGTAYFGTNPTWTKYGPHGTERDKPKHVGGSRGYWNKRLDDFEEANSNYHNY